MNKQDKRLEILKQYGFDKPFTRDGEPKKWLALIVPLFNETRVKKLTMLNSCDKKITASNYKEKRGTHASTLSKLNKAGIVRTEERGNGWWYKGNNWDIFMDNLISEMMKNEKLRSRFTGMLVKYENSSVHFMSF